MLLCHKCAHPKDTRPLWPISIYLNIHLMLPGNMYHYPKDNFLRASASLKYFNNGKCPPLAVPEHVVLSQRQEFSLSHFNTSKWPPIAALKYIVLVSQTNSFFPFSFPEHSALSSQVSQSVN
jgi:hypothetical protein